MSTRLHTQSLVCASLMIAASAAPTLAETFEVTLEGISFQYNGMENMNIDLTINQGDTVRWVWVEGLHNVVSGFPESGNEGELFFSGEPTNVPGTAFEFTFDVPPGDYGYHCHPHAEVGMVSSVTVAGGAQAVPTSSPLGVVLMVFLVGAAAIGRLRRNATA